MTLDLELPFFHEDHLFFEFYIEEPLIINRTNDYDKNIFNITEIMNKKIEEFIKRDPAHWLWSHDRWK